MAAGEPDRGLDPPAQGSPLPPRHPGMVGREAEIAEIASHLLTHRFVTILGPGSIGKTTTAVPVAYSLLDAFGGAVRFVDLGPVSDPRLVPSALAATLGLLVQSSDPLATLTAYLRDKRLLLVLDSCEHVIDAAAGVAEAVHQQAPDVHLLITSREVLRAQGEYTYRLPPLEFPPADVPLTAAQAMGFPAVQLFVDRVTATEGGYRLTDADAPTVCEICRKLDGMALAIELAAGRVGAFGVQQTAQLLEGQFSLQWQGRRTALPRHQTLAATLDWSYDLLSEPERLMLRRLSAFSGRFALGAAEAVMAGGADGRESLVLRRLAVFEAAFSLQAACAVAGQHPLDAESVVSGLGNLVDKPLISAEIREGGVEYRLLDTTRAYALEKLDAGGERAAAGRWHAHHVLAVFQDAPVEWRRQAPTAWLRTYRRETMNALAALD